MSEEDKKLMEQISRILMNEKEITYEEQIRIFELLGEEE